MNKKLILLAERRERLIAQAAAQRMVLAQNIEPWRVPLARADQGLAALRYIKNHPAWVVGASPCLLHCDRAHREMAGARLGNMADDQ